MVKQLTDILLEGGLVDEAELAAAYDEHQRAGRSLGRVLVEHGVLSEAQLVEALAQQIGLPFVDLAEYTVDGAAVALVPAAVCRRHTVLPVGFDEGKLVLVTGAEDPLGRKRTPVTLGELRDRSVLLLDDGHCLREQALAFCTSAKTRELEFRATSLSTLTQMVAGGAGVTLLPELALSTELRRADLRVRPLAAPVPSRTIALAWRRSSPLAAPLRQLAATLRRAYPEGDGATGPKRAKRGR